MSPRRAALLLAALVVPRPAAAQSEAPAPRVIPIYLVPHDLSVDLERLRLDERAIADVRQWYRRALRGTTFHADPLIVLHSRHTFAELAADDFQAWWPLLGAELADYGFDWQHGADFKLLLLVAGAGAWAGADSENGGIERIEDAARVDRGAFGGLVVIGDSAVGGILAGVCPMDGTRGGTAWWCSWDTYRGTIAHELGHAWGIPHPDAFNPKDTAGNPEPWDCAADGNTVMQCHWNFPYDSLLPYEATHMRSLPFFADAPVTPYVLLSEVLPTALAGDVAIRRLGTARDAAAGIFWVDDLAAGSATGYPWAVRIGTGGRVTWHPPAGCGTLVADVGRARAAGGLGVLELAIDGVQVLAQPVGGGRPVPISLPYCAAETMELAVTGQQRFRAVLGNVRIYPDSTRAARPGQGRRDH